MIEEIVSKIKSAEDEADSVIKDSYLRGRDIVLSAEKEAERKVKEAFKEVKAQSEENENKLFEELENNNISFIEQEKKESEDRYKKKLLSVEKFSDIIVEKYKNSSI